MFTKENTLIAVSILAKHIYNMRDDNKLYQPNIAWLKQKLGEPQMLNFIFTLAKNGNNKDILTVLEGTENLLEPHIKSGKIVFNQDSLYNFTLSPGAELPNLSEETNRLLNLLASFW